MKITLDQDPPAIPTYSRYRNISLKEGLTLRVEDCNKITEAAFIEHLPKLERDLPYVSVTVGVEGSEFEDVQITFPFIRQPKASGEFSICCDNLIAAQEHELKELRASLLCEILAKDYHVMIIHDCEDPEDYRPELIGIGFRLIRNDHKDWSEEVFIPQEQVDKILVLTEDPEANNYDLNQEAICDSLRQEKYLDDAAEEIAAASRR